MIAAAFTTVWAITATFSGMATSAALGHAVIMMQSGTCGRRARRGGVPSIAHLVTTANPVRAVDYIIPNATHIINVTKGASPLGAATLVSVTSIGPSVDKQSVTRVAIPPPHIASPPPAIFTRPFTPVVSVVNVASSRSTCRAQLVRISTVK